MKKVTLNLILTFFLIMLFSSFNLQAQQGPSFPDGDLGIGAQLGPDNIYGVVGSYALSKDFHIGVNFGFQYMGGVNGSSSSTKLLFAPFGMYYFNNIKSFRPFIKAEFQINSSSVSTTNPNQPNTFYSVSTTSTGLMIDVGGEWFATKSVGVFAGFELIQLYLDPSQFNAGIGTPFVGIQWFVF
jgi:hypothetical protein